MSTATQDDDLDDAAGQYPSTVMNKYHCEITQEQAGDDDDDHPGVGDGQEDDRFDNTEEIDPEDEEFDDPNDSQTQAEKQSTTTTPWSIFQRCSWLLKSPSEN